MSPASRRRARLDDLIAERGLAADRAAAARLLLTGHVKVGHGDGARTNHKPGDLVHTSVAITLVARPRFVSRGGDKLNAALERFDIDVGGCVCLDVGASTGGFTDVLLRRGAARVYALDVGRGQLAEVLRGDPRVISMERTHAGRLDPDSPDPLALPEPINLAVIDVSFISLTRVLRGVAATLDGAGQIVALVKPQFEVPPEQAPGGVVRAAEARDAAVDRVVEHGSSLGLRVRGRMQSPLRGPAGNVEFLVCFAQA